MPAPRASPDPDTDTEEVPMPVLTAPERKPLVAKLKSGQELVAPDFATFYTPGEKGYTDY